ncbi:radical SAM protein [Clostridium gelidum]|uniref:Radical SAM protein n=1 Tax=Clostridium gelidum TaxID=704125 RepID=A0ABN6J2R6_9CLOT|nr:radical SAM/SPASM domain-containing protein [Clostridium gelidum]BCZ48619.1 radical SAM protein [Clostridium gelidum]
MKAKVKPRISLNERTKLEDVIPLETPFTVFIDVSSACNFSCEFCFNRDKNNIGRMQEVMKFDLYKKIIDDLTKFSKKIKCIRLYKEGEPLINKWLPDMIKYAKEKDVADKIEFTTNGSLLNIEKNKELIDAGLDRIVISVEALSKEKYKSISKVDIDFEEYISNIKHFYDNKKQCKVCIKSTDIGVKGEEEKFYEIFGDISDEIFIENITPIWPNFEIGELKEKCDKGLYGQELEKVNICPYIFYSLTINSDGTVSACFVDWEHKIIVGDVKEQSFYDIWNGEKLKELRIMHLKKMRGNHETCGKCGQLDFGASDNLDKYSEKLLKNLI